MIPQDFMNAKREPMRRDPVTPKTQTETEVLSAEWPLSPSSPFLQADH